MPDKPLRLLILGAHPDDAEYHAGGLATLYRDLGHEVKMVSVTNGAAGHHALPSDELARVRRAEAAAAGEVIGAMYVTWDNPDGELQPTLDVRRQIIREIRSFAPDLVLTHRTSDYHPDHRAVGQAVQDASYMVTVPLVCPETPALRRDPIVAYMTDLFTRPCPLRADVVLDVSDCVEQIIDMLTCHVSQMYEWLPYNEGVADQVPPDLVDRRRWLKARVHSLIGQRAQRFRAELIRTYGRRRGAAAEFAEAYEISEYAAPLDDAAKARLFPFLPRRKQRSRTK